MSKTPSNKTLGRPPMEITKELTEDICNVIRAGAYVETAVAFVGLGKTTFYKWLKMAKEEDPDPSAVSFANAIKQAMAQAEMRDVMVIDDAAQGIPVLDDKGDVVDFKRQPVWQAAAWRLERKFPKKWGRKAMVKLEPGEPGTGGDAFEEEMERINREVAEEIEQLEDNEDSAPWLAGTLDGDGPEES